MGRLRLGYYWKQLYNCARCFLLHFSSSDKLQVPLVPLAVLAVKARCVPRVCAKVKHIWEVLCIGCGMHSWISLQSPWLLRRGLVLFPGQTLEQDTVSKTFLINGVFSSCVTMSWLTHLPLTEMSALPCLTS